MAPGTFLGKDEVQDIHAGFDFAYLLVFLAGVVTVSLDRDFPVDPERYFPDDQFHGVTVLDMDVDLGFRFIIGSDAEIAATLGKQFHGQGVTSFVQGFSRHVVAVHLFRKCSDAVIALLLGNRLESRLEHPDGHPFAEDGGSQLAYVNLVVLFLRLRDIHSQCPRCCDGHTLEATEAGGCRLQTVGAYIPYGNTH